MLGINKHVPSIVNQDQVQYTCSCTSYVRDSYFVGVEAADVVAQYPRV